MQELIVADHLVAQGTEALGLVPVVGSQRERREPHRDDQERRNRLVPVHRWASSGRYPSRRVAERAEVAHRERHAQWQRLPVRHMGVLLIWSH